MKGGEKLVDVLADNYLMLFKLAISIVKDESSACDVIQNVALSILIKDYRLSDINNPIAFLSTCVRRTSLNYLRDSSRAYPTDPNILAETHKDVYSHGATDYVEWVATLEKYLFSYSSQLQKAFAKHYVDGYPLAPISEELEMTPNALAQQFKRMRKKIATQTQST